MLSLSMSFLLWSWARSRGSWAIHRRGRAEKPAKKPDLFSTRPPVGGAPERSQAGFYELRAGVESMSRPARGFWVFLSSQNRPCLRAAEPVPALRWRALGSTSARPRLRLHPSSTFQAAKPEPSRTRAERARAAGPPSSQHSPRRSRRDNAPSTAPLRRGRPARRPEEVDPRDDPGHGARTRRAKAADGGPEGPEGAREA